MKICHWTLGNNSGLDKVATELSKAEAALGLKSFLMSSANNNVEDVQADIHCIHSHLPDSVSRKGKKIIWFAHGTPEYTMQTSMIEGLNKGYGAGDSWMLREYWMAHSDCIVTFWDRHRAIIKSMCDKHTRVELIPMGIDKDFWKPVPSRGKYAGTPSLFTAENCHFIKWPFDLFVAWPWVTENVPAAKLHVAYLPYDQHRWWFPMINSNGASFRSYISPTALDRESLRNTFVSTDYYVNLVRYGDFNRIGMEAASCGVKIISYKGNPYSHYHINEGDQREMARELTDILEGHVKDRGPLVKTPSSIIDMAEAMKDIYETI